MFDLVADVQSYPEFLPGCSGSSVETTNAHDVLVATLEIRKGPLRQAFSTRNVNTRGSSIKMTLVRGPFKHLEGRWSFTSLGENGSRVALEIDFQFSNSLVRGAFGKVFHHVSGEMLDAFCRRAEVIYGQR